MEAEISGPASLELSPPATPFVGRLYVPRELHGVRPGLLVIGGSGGGIPWQRGQAAAMAGIPSLAIAYFKAPGLPDSLRAIPLEYFGGALRWLSGHPAVDPHRVVVLGVSRGSEAAMLAGVHFSELVAAVVAIVPGNVVLGSWPPGGPAWTLNGEALPFVSRFGPDCLVPEAFIPIERIKGPVALVGAGRDQVWPSLAMARALAERRKAGGGSHPYDLLLEYPSANHDVGAFVPAAGAIATPAGADRMTPPDDAGARLLRFIRAVPLPGGRV